ncbi:ribose-phosphate pyrophosphokinase [Candidatus Levyibacteriota bacterium]|nr:ribose-phosphate diphosphokinase [Candidatus Levybacteria bacterium]GDX62048.1 ribose-phosphate pyrophosphokinase [Candidatus Levybacteria bacterium]
MLQYLDSYEKASRIINVMQSKTDDLILITGRANIRLAKDIAKILGKEEYLDNPISQFSDGELRIKIPHNLRQRHVVIIQSMSMPVNDSIMELILLIDAVKRSSAREITALIPYFGYSRQDRKEMPRVPISASVIAGIIQYAGADRIITVDIHSEQQQGFVKMPWDNLYGSYALLPIIKKRKLDNLIVASPDKGGVPRATKFAQFLGADGVAIVFKERDLSINNNSEAFDMIGDVMGKNVLLVDDMIDTGGSITKAASLIKQRGAKTVRAVAIHGLFSGDALRKIVDSPLDEVIITDTISHREEVVTNPKIIITSVAPLLAEVIRRTQTGESISKDLIL